MCVIRYLTVSNGSCISRKRRQLPKQYKPLQDVFIGCKPFTNLNNQLTLNHIHKNTSLRYFNESSYVNLSIYGQMSQITHTKKIWTFRLPSLDSKLEYDFLSTSVTRTAIRFYFKSAIWSFIGSFLIERVLMWIPYSFILHPEQVGWQSTEQWRILCALCKLGNHSFLLSPQVFSLTSPLINLQLIVYLYT